MKRLWELLADHWPLEMPRAHLRRELGDEVVEGLERAGLASRAVVQPGTAYPCPHASRLGCQREVSEIGGLVARCTASPAACADEPIAPGDAVWLRVGATELVPRLQRALGLDAIPVDGSDRPIHLGTRRLGKRVTDFVLIPRAGVSVRAGGWVPDRYLVALTLGPAPAGMPDDSVRRVRLATEWDPLGDAGIDLGEIPVDAESAARSTRYVFAIDEDAERYWFRGAPLDLQRRTHERRVLNALLRQAGRWIPRDRLYARVWPDEAAGLDPTTLETRLRQLKPRLIASLGDEAIVQTRWGSDAGWRLDVAPDRIWWSSLADPDADEP